MRRPCGPRGRTRWRMPRPSRSTRSRRTDPNRAVMLSGLSQQVTLAAIEAARGRAWMLHAAGIATPDGQVVVLVGPSGRGKTTASRALGGGVRLRVGRDRRDRRRRAGLALPQAAVGHRGPRGAEDPAAAVGRRTAAAARCRAARRGRRAARPRSVASRGPHRRGHRSRRRARGADLADELPARPAGRAAVHRRARGRDRRHPHGEVPRGGHAALGDSRARAARRRRSRCSRSPRTSRHLPAV